MTRASAKIFVISGLGADHRAFEKLHYLNARDPHHIAWLKPEAEESISSYATRLIKTNDIRSESTLIGLSFGGMIAAEISKQVDLDKLILISSARNKFDLPISIRLIAKMGILKVIPSFLFNNYNPLVGFAFGVGNSGSRNLLRQIISDTDPAFARWALQAIGTWSHSGNKPNAVRIHGTKDRLIPAKNTVDHKIEAGGHFMVWDKAEEIDRLVVKLIYNQAQASQA